MNVAEVANLSPSLSPDKLYHRQDLLRFFQAQHPSYVKNGVSWLISAWLKEGKLYRAGYDLYSSSPLRHYAGGAAEEPLLSIQKTILKKGIKAVIFDSAALNEWLNELIVHNTVIVEVERPRMEEVFSLLQAAYPSSMVLLNPTAEERLHYSRGDDIVILPLASRSPMVVGNGKMCLEKLVVDLYADKGLRQFFPLNETDTIAWQMMKSYHFDERSMRCYAARRHVSLPIANVLDSLTKSCPDIS
jgi:hypothetical protein